MKLIDAFEEIQIIRKKIHALNMFINEYLEGVVSCDNKTKFRTLKELNGLLIKLDELIVKFKTRRDNEGCT